MKRSHCFQFALALLSPSRALSALLVFLFGISLAGAAKPYVPDPGDPIREPWRWRSFDALRGADVSDMAVGKDGSLYFATREGVTHYDGVRWTSYAKEDLGVEVPVLSVLVARDGSVYAGSVQGMSRFKAGKWQRHFPSEDNFYWLVRDIVQGLDGSIWAATAFGVFCFREQAVVFYTSSEVAEDLPEIVTSEVEVVSVPPNLAEGGLVAVPYVGVGVTWSGTGVVFGIVNDSPADRAGVKLGDRILTDVREESPEGSSKSTLILERAGHPAPIELVVTRAEVKGISRQFSVGRIVEGRNGVMWFSLVRGKIGSGHPAKGDWTLHDPAPGSGPGTPGQRLLQDTDGTIWAVNESEDHGVSRIRTLDGSTGEWSSFRLSEAGGSDVNSAVFEASDGTIWVTGNALHVLRNESWAVYQPEEIGIPARCNAIAETPDGAIWFLGASSDLLRLDYGSSRWTTHKGLLFQAETEGGDRWFLAEDGAAVRQHRDARGIEAWTRYDSTDGAIDAPVQILVTQDGGVWVFGSHNHLSAAARFDGRQWTREIHEKVSWGVRAGSAFEDGSGGIWISTITETRLGYKGGVLNWRGGTWTRFEPPTSAPWFSYDFAQTPDGILWLSGRRGLYRLDIQTQLSWREVDGVPEALKGDRTRDLLSGGDGSLWVGTKASGVYRVMRDSATDSLTYQAFGFEHTLADNQVLSLALTDEGRPWASTPRGVSRFDGLGWSPHVLPQDLPAGRLVAVSDGSLYLNVMSEVWERRARPGSKEEDPGAFLTIRYQPDREAPHTKINLAVEEVGQPGNTTITWEGSDPWQSTSSDELQYAWRLRSSGSDSGAWSAFSNEKSRIFQSLESGAYTFEVKARDLDFNEDSTPDLARFVVLPPVWQQAWFLATMSLLVGAVCFQTGRIVRRDRRLREANEALSSANKELFNANIEIRQQSERKSAFLASMSHELRTPMNAIMGFTRLVLRREPELTPRGKENLQKVGQASDHLMGLINDILDLSKIEAGKMDVVAKRFDVKHLIGQCVSTVSPLVKEGVALRCEVGEGVGEAFTDEGRVRQMVINLLSNAIKFTEAGEVKVKCGVRSAEFKVGGESQVIAILEIAVSDTGKGIPKDELPFIFDEYRQVKGSESSVQKGTGLGLSITKKFAELLGGNISVESEMGKGSAFTVRIPAVYERGGGQESGVKGQG